MVRAGRTTPTYRPIPVVRAAVAALVAAFALLGCDAGGEPSHASPSPVQRASREYRDGHLVFTVLSLRCGLTAVAGTHSEAQPDGQYCTARLRVRNADPAFHTYVAAQQRLVSADGARATPDSFAMAVRRQHERVEIGGHDLIEIEIWYDVPKRARVTGMRVSGDRDPDGYLSGETVRHAPDGVFVPLKPLTGP
ncbi:DUF4352 domain-containing protein [Streptomyces sp. Ru71]|uniref:DUF4352 domain-containing protein n=1 Tax=Streptomyces sp. Ru71 TaxID=2080746 RepID=UPI0011AFDE9C|nr:DUF4352 domain-containing protein [Streptomyces sp. Ru71]